MSDRLQAALDRLRAIATRRQGQAYAGVLLDDLRLVVCDLDSRRASDLLATTTSCSTVYMPQLAPKPTSNVGLAWGENDQADAWSLADEGWVQRGDWWGLPLGGRSPVAGGGTWATCAPGQTLLDLPGVAASAHQVQQQVSDVVLWVRQPVAVLIERSRRQAAEAMAQALQLAGG